MRKIWSEGIGYTHAIVVNHYGRLRNGTATFGERISHVGKNRVLQSGVCKVITDSG